MAAWRKIIWAPLALKDLEETFDFIRADNAKAARAWVQAVLNHIEKLARFPKLGRVIPELGSVRYRELVVGHYRIFHEVTAREIRIFRIFHTKRLFPA